MLENIVPRIQQIPDREIEFDAQLAIEENSVKVTVKIDDAGLTMTTKKDHIHFPRSTWLDAGVVKNAVYFIVSGYGYDQWSKKRKFEKKNPGETFSDFPDAASSYSLGFKPKKLPEGVSVAELDQRIKKTFVLAYLDEVQDPKIVECPDCKTMMDVTPYQSDDSLFCENCSRLIGVPDEPDRGICDGCQYYTQLVEQKKEEGGEGSITTSRICHPCRVSQTFWGFLMALGAAILIGLLNFATLFFANRYFPVLIIAGVLSLLWSVFQLVKVIIYSAARKATGGSPLANVAAQLKKGNTDKALEIINTLDGDFTQNPGMLMNLSRGLANSGDFAKAEEFADIMIGNFPNFQFGYLEKIGARAGLGADETELNELMEQAIAVGACNSVRSVRRAKLMAAMGD
jgi:hypothetical protein